MKPFRLFSCLLILAFLYGCYRPWQGSVPTVQNPIQITPVRPAATQPAALAFIFPPTRDPGTPILTPTPDSPHALPSIPTDTKQHVVQAGDTLALIAKKYGTSLASILSVNSIPDPDQLEVGQTLQIPPPQPGAPGPAFKIIPDSELVNSPSAIQLDVNAIINQHAGYLSQYHQDVNGTELSGAEVINRVALEYSVHPRLLLAILEYQSNWLTQASARDDTLDFPLGFANSYYKGLYLQLSWAANNLNRGYYLWKVNAVPSWTLADGSVIPAEPTINAGTAAVQSWFGLLYGENDWRNIVGPDGFIKTYQNLFGYPFDYALEPLLPPDLSQPTMQLPLEQDATWSFTGGPHGGWGAGSAWAALDFAPPGEGKGCVQSNAWVTATAGGRITRSADGAVILDLDGDGHEQTGWTVLYLHIETRDRISAGSLVKAGDHIGHPSCEGGVSNGTHVHVARRYNGEWIPADGSLPFILDGWVSQGGSGEYNGFLKKKDQSVEAWNILTPINQIHR